MSQSSTLSLAPRPRRTVKRAETTASERTRSAAKTPQNSRARPTVRGEVGGATGSDSLRTMVRVKPAKPALAAYPTAEGGSVYVQGVVESVQIFSVQMAWEGDV